MDSTRFDHLAIAVGQRSTRRYALGLLAAVGLTGLLGEDAAAACLASGRAAGAGGDHAAPACARDPRAEDLPLSAADLLPVRHRLGSLRLVTDFDACIARCEELTGTRPPPPSPDAGDADSASARAPYAGKRIARLPTIRRRRPPGNTGDDGDAEGAQARNGPIPNLMSPVKTLRVRSPLPSATPDTRRRLHRASGRRTPAVPAS